jgi:hypothetical protein
MVRHLLLSQCGSAAGILHDGIKKALATGSLTGISGKIPMKKVAASPRIALGERHGICFIGTATLEKP